MNKTTYILHSGDSPIIATAIHNGHEVREALQPFFNLTKEERLREEDPFTAEWVNFSDNNIVVNHSRFETDVNRPRDKAVYLLPEDAWGLKVWKTPLTEEVISDSLQVYDAFYETVKKYMDELFDKHPCVVVFDLHSYNHQREKKGINAPAYENPEINIGTKNMNRKRWAPLIESLINSLQSFDYNGRNLDVRENIKFKGGYFGQWLYEQYGDRICPVSIEFKKFFMDEWSGFPFEKDIQLIRELMESTAGPVLESLKKINNDSGN